MESGHGRCSPGDVENLGPGDGSMEKITGAILVSGGLIPWTAGMIDGDPANWHHVIPLGLVVMAVGLAFIVWGMVRKKP